MNRLSHAVILFVLLLYPSVTQAEPSKTLEYLMNEPASMLDIGIFKLNRELDNSDSEFNYADKSLKKIAAVASYDYEKNKLIIDFRYRLNLYLFTTKGWDAKDVCKDQLSRVRRKFGFDYSGERNKDSEAMLREFLSTANYFIHSGYKRTNMPKNFGTEIENISYVRIDIWGGKPSARCEGGLYSKEVLFHDK